MWRILLYFIVVTLAALGFAWLADRPGDVNIVWQGYDIRFSVMALVIGFLLSIALIMFTWWLLKSVLFAPGRMSHHMKVKAREKGLDAVSRGLIAVSAGDARLAHKLAHTAGRKLQSDSLSTLLKAQAAQLSGDRHKARQLYEAMLENPETEVAGLRGLYLEARREKEIEAARQFAQKAVERNPRLSWSNQALLEIQSRSGQWGQALKTLELSRKHKKVDKRTYSRQRAVLLTAQAMENEQNDMEKALNQALEAHRLADDLVPAATVAGRILAARGNVGKASKIIARTWESSPHPDLALTYAHARPGDSPRDRLARVVELAERTPHNMEGPIAIAEAAIESHDWSTARKALKKLLDKRPTERVCTLMARIEGGEYGDKGRVREWLARAVRAPKDPSWTADGYVSEHWAPVSPITGNLDAFLWKVPIEQLGQKDEELPFDEFIPLKAEMKGTEMQDAETGTQEAPPRQIEDVVQNPVEKADESIKTGDQAARKTEPLPSKTVETGADKSPVDATPAASSPSLETEPAKPVEATASSKSQSRISPLRETQPRDAIHPPAHEGEGAERSQTEMKADIEEAEIIEPQAKRETSPSIPGSDSDSDTASGAKTDMRDKAVSPAPDIYIPPPPPDDPGPLGAGSALGNPRKSPKLPQRYRQSS